MDLTRTVNYLIALMTFLILLANIIYSLKITEPLNVVII